MREREREERVSAMNEKRRERFKMEREREREANEERANVLVVVVVLIINIIIVVIIIIIIIARTSSCRSSGFTSIREGRRLSMYEELFPFLRVCAFDAKKKVKKREKRKLCKKTRAEGRWGAVTAISERVIILKRMRVFSHRMYQNHLSALRDQVSRRRDVLVHNLHSRRR
jgi:hypothetical protein